MRTEQQLAFPFHERPFALLTPNEIYERLDEGMLRRLTPDLGLEDDRVELKPSSIHRKELGEYFSMWANSPPAGGILVIGIRNNTEFEGCSSLGTVQLNQLTATPEDYCSDAVYAVKRVAIHRDSDGKEDFVVVFRVEYHKTKVVRTAEGKVYVRRADRKKQLKTADEIGLLQESKGEVRLETTTCHQLEYPKDFDTDSLGEFAETVRERKEWSLEHTRDAILELMNLGQLKPDGTFAPNVACALLFAKNPRTVIPGCQIRFLRFEGEREEVGERWNTVKDEFIDGTIPQQIERTAVILRSQLRTFSRLDKNGQFMTAVEYPEPAWYEAVVNACVHRSYGNGLKNRMIFVRMFDDRLEVESPGAFPPFVTPETVYSVQHSRNPFLMEAMYFLKYVKMAHEGARRMKAEMVKMGLPSPEFRQDELEHSAVRVTLRNNIKQRRVWVDSDVAAILGKQLAASLTEEQKRCVNHVAEYGSINVSTAMRLTKHEWGTVKRLLSSLVEKGILRRVVRTDIQRDPKAHYVLQDRLAQQGSRTP